MNKALIIVDTQNDFCPGGKYPVPNGDYVVKPLNKMIAHAINSGWKIFASRDWHKESLFKDKPEKAHCVQNTTGAEYHPDLKISSNVTIISKGMNDLGEIHYSAFNGDDISLEDELKLNKIKEVYIGGLALDYCVKNTAIDAIKFGFSSHVLIDATKPVKKPPSQIYKELKHKGVIITTVDEVVAN